MKVATLEDGTREGRPAVVPRGLTRAVDGTDVTAAPRTAFPRFGDRSRAEMPVVDGLSSFGAIDGRVVSLDEALAGAAT